MIEQDVPFWIAVPAALLLVIAGLAAFTGSLGLLRLGNFYRRIHAPTLGNTLGVAGVLLASVLVTSCMQSRLIVHEMLITLLLFLTSPITAMMLMRAAIFRKCVQGNMSKEVAPQSSPISQSASDDQS